jgi:phage repressor protein C with HTH and peptisase S24 domain
MPSLSKRLLSLVEHLPEQGRIGAIASAAGVSYQAARKWMTGETQQIKAPYARKIGAWAGVNPLWIMGESSTRSSSDSTRPLVVLGDTSDTTANVVWFPRIRVDVSAGPGVLVTDERSATSLSLSKDYVQRWLPTVRPESARFVDVVGDSMSCPGGEIDIPDGSIVLVDTSDITVRNEKVYVVRLGDELRVKQLRISPVDRSVKLHSLNPAYQADDLIVRQEDWGSWAHLIGRAVYYQKGRAL